jgi:hypothetical protein
MVIISKSGTESEVLCFNGSRYSNRLQTGWPGFDSQECMIFLFSTASKPNLGPTQPPIQWVPGAPFPGIQRKGCEADRHLHLVLRSRMVELYLHSAICLHGNNYAQGLYLLHYSVLTGNLLSVAT